MWEFPLFPEEASTYAKSVDMIYLGLAGVAVVFTVIVAALIIVFSIRYRRGSSASRANPITHSTFLEGLFIGVPTILGVLLFTWSAMVFFQLQNPPGNALEVYVMGKQWMWKLQHPEGASEINTLHVPVGQPVRLIMTSQDVIHSFYIPAFRIKQDVLPGRYTSVWFEPTKVGRFRIFCTEYCGTDHSRMGGWVEVMEPADYEAWLQGGSGNASLAATGEQLFRQYSCSGCHGVSSNYHAPRLDGVYGGPVPIKGKNGVEFVLADERYVRDSILLPDSQVVAGYENPETGKSPMPSYQGQIPEDHLLQLIAYIKSIGKDAKTRARETRGNSSIGEVPEFVNIKREAK